MNVLQSFPPLAVVSFGLVVLFLVRQAFRAVTRLLATGVLVGITLGVAGTMVLGGLL